MDTGVPQFVDATNHATPGLGTSEIVSHMAKGSLVAAFQYDGALATHQQMAADQNAALLKTFSLHDSTTVAPGMRWRWNGYYGGQPIALPVSGLASAQLTISVEAGWVYEADV